MLELSPLTFITVDEMKDATTEVLRQMASQSDANSIHFHLSSNLLEK